MTPLIFGLCLLAMMIAAKFWADVAPLSEDRPLDVDRGLPWPEAAQASSVFSLTALFGTFLSLGVLVGFPALVGAAFGSVGALIIVRRAVVHSAATSYEEFVLERLVMPDGRPTGVLNLLVLTQLGFALSELTILREVAISGLGMLPRHALILGLSVALVAYYYCLIGGYRTLFRADAVQFLAIALMCGVLAFAGIRHIVSGATLHLAERVTANPDVWNPGTAAFRTPFRELLLTTAHVILGLIAGAVYVLASPDTWKRIFVAVRMRGTQAVFWRLVVAGALPFVCLLPMMVLAPPTNAQTFVPILFFFAEQQLGVRNTLVVLGITGTFLSSFAGALLSAAHLVVLSRRGIQRDFREIRTFQIALAASFLVVTFGALALAATTNPFVVAYALVGLYGVTGGMLAGATMVPTRLPSGRANPILSILLTAWALYLAHDLEALRVWTIREADCVVFAAPLAVIAFLATRGLLRKGSG